MRSLLLAAPIVVMSLDLIYLSCLVCVAVLPGMAGLRRGTRPYFGAILFTSLVLFTLIGLGSYLGPFEPWVAGPGRGRSVAVLIIMLLLGVTFIAVAIVALNTKFAKRLSQICWGNVQGRRPVLVTFGIVVLFLAGPLAVINVAYDHPVPNYGVLKTDAPVLAKSVYFLATPGSVPTIHQVHAAVALVNQTLVWNIGVYYSGQSSSSVRYTLNDSRSSSAACLYFGTHTWKMRQGACTAVARVGAASPVGY